MTYEVTLKNFIPNTQITKRLAVYIKIKVIAKFLYISAAYKK